MNRENVFAILEKKADLPTLPAVMTRLTSVVNDPNADASQVAKIIKDDPAMTARILKLVNSAAYFAGENISSIQHAVARMGFTAIKNVALSTSVFKAFDPRQSTGFNRQEFWRHSVCVGIAANVLYRKTESTFERKMQRDIMHLAGLLHDIGKIVFESQFRDQFMEAVRAASTDSRPLFEAEREVFGVDHCEVGAWLAERWKLAPAVVAAIRCHHDPESAEPAHLDLVRLCHTANHICNLEHIGDGGDNTAPSYNIGVWKRLGLGVRDIAEMVAEVVEQSKMSETLMAFG